MAQKASHWRDDVRIVAAITAKDLVEALKNKNSVSVLLVSLLMVLFYRWMPALLIGHEPLNLLVFDADNSQMLARLEQSPLLTVHTCESPAAMERRLADGDVPELGLVIPEGFDQVLATPSQPALQGYVMRWVSDRDAQEMVRSVETEIERQAGRPVSIVTEGNRISPGPESHGLGVQAGFSILFVALMVGLLMIAHLMLEEKQSHTVEVLLVSPASAWHLVFAKALTGLFYCLLGCCVGLAVNHDLVLHWWLALFSVVAGSLFVVALGLWLGARIQDRGQLTILAWVLVVPLLIPVFLSLVEQLLPAVVAQVCRFLPTVAAFHLLRLSFADPLTPGRVMPLLATVAAWAVAGLLLAVAQVRRFDRVPQATPRIWTGTFLLGLHSAVHRWLPAPAVPHAGVSRIGPGSAAAPLPSATPAAPAPVAATLPAGTIGAALIQARPVGSLRIVGAITRKDMAEALRNKLLLGILFGVGMMVAINFLVPILLRGSELPIAIVYDEGHSTLLRQVGNAAKVRILAVASRQEMERGVSEASALRLGLVIPADFDRQAAAGQEIRLEVYAAHWARPQQVGRWATAFEQQFSLAGAGAVHLDLGGTEAATGRRLYPAADAGGQPAMITALLAIVISTLGTSLVPLLLVEEKESGTLDALLASPATPGQVVAGKALAGSAYCLLATVVLLAFNQRWFVAWGVALGAVLLGIAFVVAVGLVLGLLSGNAATTGLWGAGVLLALVALTTLALVDQVGWPAWLRSALPWTPGALLVNLIRLSMAGEMPLARLAASAVALAAESGAVFVLAGWLLHRRAR